MKERMNHRLKALTTALCVILAIYFSGVLRISSIPSVFAFSDETQPSDIQESSGSNQNESSNMMDALLDPTPKNLPQVEAREYLLYDTLSETMLIGNDYANSFQPAALTQILTVLIALEELEMSDTITITKKMYESIPEEFVRIGFSEGEVVTVKDCINACLLKSANDACLALAIQISGSESAFVKKMNQRAQELGCTSSHFTNCYGKADSAHYTTCHDFAIILQEALRHSDFQTISTSASYTLEATNKYNDTRVLNNANRFVSTPSTAYEYYIGGKTGFSDDSGYLLIAGAEKEGRILVGVMTGASNAEQRYDDMISLFEYCFTNYSTTMIDSSELNVKVDTIKSQIENSLVGTNLKITEVNIEHISYYSTYQSLSSGGYSHEIDLSTLLIDPQKPHQVFQLPIYRTFSNNEKYEIGHMIVTISDTTYTAVETEKVEKDESMNIKSIIIMSIAIIALAAILIGAIAVFRRMTKKRKFNKNHRNPRIL